jgi:hypothetical protein
VLQGYPTTTYLRFSEVCTGTSADWYVLVYKFAKFGKVGGSGSKTSPERSFSNFSWRQL